MLKDRNALVSQVLGAVRELGSAGASLNAALAEARGLSFVESRALDLLERFGPLTAGELSARARLAPASVTGLVDRLVRKGAARRGPHPRDGRRVMIETVRGRDNGESGPYRDYVGMMRDLCAEYTSDQLATIARFNATAARRAREAGARLSGPAVPTATPRT